jgi:transposase
MFIRKVLHKNKKSRKSYATYKLVESIRTERGPRQRDILNLGVDFELPKQQWKDLANCIEGIITGQKSLFDYSRKIQDLASKYAKTIIRRQASVVDEGEDAVADYETVDVNSVDNEQARSVGAEYVIYETIKEVELDGLLKSFGFNKHEISAALGVIAGRMIAPGSERATHYWLQNNTALDELMGVDFSTLSLDRIYKLSDILIKNKDAIEEHLSRKEGELFALEEKIILYDLTNTFFEGSAKSNPKARYGKSKERRNDCPLVTLGLVLDIDGFAKKSRIYEGGISEPKTLEQMIKGLSDEPRFEKPTIVLDAGIATEENIRWLKDNAYHYIVVSRQKKKEIPADVDMVTVKEDDRTKAVLVQAGVFKNPETDELELYCRSVDKAKKEEGIKNRFQQRFEGDLLKARNALDLKNGTKRYEKVVERIGRLKEKYKLVSHRYQVKVEKDSETDRAKNIKWKLTKVEKTSGIYCLRTNQKELTEQQIWDIYTMLTDAEDAFRCMKSHLGLRPIYHQKEDRCDAHIFITVIAYHFLHTIRYKLRQKGVRYNWATLRKQLSTQVRITTTMKRKDNKVVYIRRSTKAEPPHQVIYDALGLSHQPGRTVKTVL